MKIFEVVHMTYGDYIGHSLYEENHEVVSRFTSKLKADEALQRLKAENVNEIYYVREAIVE